MIVIAEEEFEAALGPGSHQIRQPVLGMIRKGVLTRLVGPLEIKGVARKDEEVGAESGIFDLW
jgi:hypothetical protein